MLNFEDFLCHRHLSLLDLGGAEVRAVSALPSHWCSQRTPCQLGDLTALADQQCGFPNTHWLEHADRAVRANAMVCLIDQADHLLDWRMLGVGQALITKEDYSKQLAAEKLRYGRRCGQGNRSEQSDQAYEFSWRHLCSKRVTLGTAEPGKNAGQTVFGELRLPKIAKGPLIYECLHPERTETVYKGFCCTCYRGGCTGSYLTCVTEA